MKKKPIEIDHFHYTLKLRYRDDFPSIGYVYHDDLTNFDKSVICSKFVKCVLGEIPLWITFQISKHHHKGWRKGTHVSSRSGIFCSCKALTHLGGKPIETCREISNALIDLNVAPGQDFYYKISKA